MVEDAKVGSVPAHLGSQEKDVNKGKIIESTDVILA